MRNTDAAELWKAIVESGKVESIFINEDDNLKTSVISLEELHKILVSCIYS